MVSSRAVQSIDVTGSAEGIVRPIGIAVMAEGRLAVTDRRGRIVEMTPMGVTRTLAGSASGYMDGDNATARFRAPTGLAAARDGALVVADAGNRMIRLLDLPAPAMAIRPAPPGLTGGFDLARFAALAADLAARASRRAARGRRHVRRSPRESRRHRTRSIFTPASTCTARTASSVLAVRDGKGGSTDPDRRLRLAQRVTRDRADHLRPHARRTRPAQSPAVAGRCRGPVRRHGPAGADPRAARLARARRAEAIGTVNRFRHVHLTVRPLGEELNPLEFRLPGFVDTIPPTIAPRGIELMDLSGQPIKARQRGRLVVSTPVRIVVDAWDRVDGNAASRRLGVRARLSGARIGWSSSGRLRHAADDGSDSIACRPTPRPRSRSTQPAAAFHSTARDAHASSYVVTSGLDESGRVVDVPWDASALPPGDYVLRVIVKDAGGNRAIAGRDVKIVRP